MENLISNWTQINANEKRFEPRKRKNTKILVKNFVISNFRDFVVKFLICDNPENLRPDKFFDINFSNYRRIKMKNLNKILGLLLATIVFPTFAFSSEKLDIVTTTLEAADFVREVGGDKVNVHSLYNGQFDFHFYEPRPTEAVRLRKADGIVVYGLATDAWFQPLIEAARNANISFGAKGYIDMADRVGVLKVPAGGIDGRMGHVHPYGACGYLYTPENSKIAIMNIYEGLIRLDPANKDYYEKNKNEYLSKIDETFEKLNQKMSPHRGTKIVQFHETWHYFAETFGLEIVAALEPKPGIPPSPVHLASVVDIIREKEPKFIMVEPYYPKRPVRFVAEQTGIKEIRAPHYVGGVKGINTFIGNLEYVIGEIIKVLEKQ